MRFLKKNISLILSVMLSVVLVLLVSQCDKSNNLERDLESTTNFLETEKEQAINRDFIYAKDMKDMKQNLMSEVSARNLLEKEFERFRSISSHTRFESTTRIDTMYIPYVSNNNNIIADYTGYIPVDTVSKYFIQTPKGLSFNDGWFTFAGTIDTSGMVIDSMRFINKFDVTIGYKKSDKPFAFLRKKEPVVELISYNPYTSINYINNIVVEDDKKSIFVSKPAFFIYGGVLAYGILKLNQ